MKTKTTHIPSGYKPSPLGPIPKDWEVKSVKDISTIKGRIGYRGYTIDDIVNDGDGAISLSPSNIVDGKLQFNSVTSITWEKYYESPEIMLHNGDIVMVKTGSSFGKVAFVDNLPHETTINPQFVIINNIKCDNKWLCYLFDSDCIQKNVHKIVVGGAIPTMSQEEIANFRIPIPPFPEQHHIVSILSLWDTAIEKQTALIEKLTLRKRGLMQQLLTGKKRLKGFSEEWKEVRLGETGTAYGGLVNKNKEDFENGNAQFITYMNVFSNGKIDTDNLGQVQILPSEKQEQVQYGDIFFTVSSETPDEVGMASVLLNEVQNTYLNSFCFGYRLNDFKTIVPVYASYLFRGDDFRKKMYKISQGSTRFNISKTEVLNMRITIPSTDEQTAIASVLANADKEIEVARKKLARLQEEKKGLMQVLLTGKRRVKIN